jgi:hypothetical protein
MAPPSDPLPDGVFRPLTLEQNELLAALLRRDFPGRDALRAQIANAHVRLVDFDGGLEFAPTPNTPAVVGLRVPVEGEATDVDGVTIHILLHVEDGFVTELELFREDVQPVMRPPKPDDVRLS